MPVANRSVFGSLVVNETVAVAAIGVSANA